MRRHAEVFPSLCNATQDGNEAQPLKEAFKEVEKRDGRGTVRARRA